MQCPQCGYVLGPFEASCPKCARLGRAPQPTGSYTGAAPVPQLGPNVGQTMPGHKACARCGGLAVLSQAACGRCGHPFEVLYAPNPQPVAQAANPFAAGPYAARGRLSRGRTWALVAVLLLLGLAAGVVAVMQSTTGGRGRWGSGFSLSMADGGRMPGADLTSAPAVASDQINRRLLQASAATGGDIEVSLAWNTLSDLDLSVREPSQTLVDAHHPHSQFGDMDVDANPTAILRNTDNPTPADVLPISADDMGTMNALSSFGDMLGGENRADEDGRQRSHVRSSYTLTPVEHIYFSKAPRGVYTVYARCYWWRESTGSPLPFTVQIKSRGEVFREVSSVIGPRNYVADRVQPTIVCQFEVK